MNIGSKGVDSLKAGVDTGDRELRVELFGLSGGERRRLPRVKLNQLERFRSGVESSDEVELPCDDISFNSISLPAGGNFAAGGVLVSSCIEVDEVLSEEGEGVATWVFDLSFFAFSLGVVSVD